MCLLANTGPDILTETKNRFAINLSGEAHLYSASSNTAAFVLSST